MKENYNMIPLLTKRSFKSNKIRNLVAILAIVLTTLMFTTLFVLSQSMNENIIQMAFRQTGHTGHASFKKITDEQIKKVSSHDRVKSYGESIVAGLAENKNLSGSQVEIRYGSEQYAKDSFAAPTTGAMPQKADEIVMDTKSLDRLGIPHKLGEKVTLEWRKDMSADVKTESTFVLSGYYEPNASVYASMVWVSQEFVLEACENAENNSEGQILGMRMMHVNLNSDKNMEKNIKDILEELNLSDLEYSVNLAYDPSMQLMAVQQNATMYMGMALVFLAGFLIIYNVFQISVSTDIQFYGKLKALGTTKKQIKKLIFGQANRLCLIGIPIGLILGYTLGAVLVPVFVAGTGGNPAISATPLIFIGSALFAWITVLLSCMRPARLAGKVSPMEALRYSDATSGGKTLKKGRNGASLGNMARGNLGRNKKRTITVICSLTLGLVLLSCFYAKNASFDLDKYLSALMIADFEVYDSTSVDYVGGYNPRGTTLSKELVSQIQELEGITETGVVYSAEEILPLSKGVLENIQGFYEQGTRLEEMSYDPDWVNAYKEAVEKKESGVVFYGAEGISLKAQTEPDKIVEGTFDMKKFTTGNYILAVIPEIDEVNETMPTYSVGDTFTILGKELTVMALVRNVNPITEGGGSYRFNLDFIMNGDTFRKLYPENTIRKYYFNVEEGKREGAEDMLKTYQEEVDPGMPFESKTTKKEQYESETAASAVMGNAISIVIALVGILNFINSMVTAIVSRRKEFAMIQSIGMTKGQLRKMLIYEGINYAVITLIISFAVSALAILFGVRPMVEGGYTTFLFTLLPMYICTPIILAFAILVPYGCFKNLEKQSMVERLRNTD